jgi:hypothetical protein
VFPRLQPAMLLLVNGTSRTDNRHPRLDERDGQQRHPALFPISRTRGFRSYSPA